MAEDFASSVERRALSALKGSAGVASVKLYRVTGSTVSDYQGGVMEHGGDLLAACKRAHSSLDDSKYRLCMVHEDNILLVVSSLKGVVGFLELRAPMMRKRDQAKTATGGGESDEGWHEERKDEALRVPQTL